MVLTARQLNRATLARQLLLRREPLDAVQAMHRVVALQAQEPASPYIALWNRLEGFDPRDLDRAFAEHAIVKASLMRITLHAVDAKDYAVFHEAMQHSLRGARLHDRRFRSSGLSSDDADSLIPELVAFTREGRTNAAAEAWMEKRFGAPKPWVWWALRHYGPFVHAPAGGPWSFGARPSYVAAPEQHRSGDQATSLQGLTRRYLEGFGPASLQDIAAFGPIRRGGVREAVDALGDALERHEGPGGTVLFDVPGGLMPHGDTPAPPRLMPMWDSILLAYADRNRMVPAGYRRLVARSNGDVLPTVLVDGYVAGVWRPFATGIEISAFHKLPEVAWAGLQAEARALLGFLADREPLVYRRYSRWWSDLPSEEVRVLSRE